MVLSQPKIVILTAVICLWHALFSEFVNHTESEAEFLAGFYGIPSAVILFNPKLLLLFYCKKKNQLFLL
jgi:hypothetical protein